jgi:Gpi18-like mannosyltransferase
MKPEVIIKRWFQDAGLKKVALFTIVFKLTTLIVITIGTFFFPFRTDNYLANFHYPHDQIPNFFTRFATWDAQHYLYLADHGYEPGLMSNTFYPLFPFLIHCLGYLFMGNTLVAGLFLSTLFTIVLMCYFYLLVQKKYGGGVAVRACLLLLAFPMSFFLGMVYADSLFLMLAITFFYYFNEQKFWLAFVCTCLLPLSKPTGILIAIPALALIFEKNKSLKIQKYFILLLGFLFGFSVYLFIFQIYTGNPWAGFNAQGYFASGYSVQTLLHPLIWFIRNFLNTHFSFNGPTDGFLSRLCFIGFVASVLGAIKKLDKSLLVYMLVVGLVSALSGDLMSYPRYIVMIFPLFVLLAVKIKDKFPYYMAICIPLQILFLILYSLNEWVA